MCWLHEKTNGLAKLPGCDHWIIGGCCGNRVGFGPQDYWISNSLPLWKSVFLVCWVKLLMLFRKKHVHKWIDHPSATGRLMMRCEECGQFEDLRGW